MSSLPGVPDEHSPTPGHAPTNDARFEGSISSQDDTIQPGSIELSSAYQNSAPDLSLKRASPVETRNSRIRVSDMDTSTLLLQEADSSGSDKSIILRRRNARFLEATERMLTNSQPNSGPRVWDTNNIHHSPLVSKDDNGNSQSLSPRDLDPPPEKEVHFFHAMLRDRDSRIFLFMMCLTGSYMVVELVVGFIISSLALQADGFHMASDLASLFIGAFALMASKRKHTPNASFGFARYEVVGALVNAVFLVALSLQIALEALARLLTYFTGGEGDDHGGLNENSGLMLYVGIGGLVVNIIGLIMFSHGGGGHGHSHGGHGHSHGGHGHSHGGHGHSHGSNKKAEHQEDDELNGEKTSLGSRLSTWWQGLSVNIQGVILHVLGDFLGSVAVIISGAIIRYTEIPHRELSDPFCSLIIVVIILLGTVPLVRGTVDVLLQKVPPGISMPELKDKILKIPGVLNIHEFHVWQLSGITLIGSLHVILDRRAKYRDVSDAIKLVLHDVGVHASTLQPEFVSVTIQKQIEALEALYLQAVESSRQSQLAEHMHCSPTSDASVVQEPLIQVHASEESPSEPQLSDTVCKAPESCPVNFSKILQQLPQLHLEQHLISALMPTMPISQIRDILNLDMCDEMICSNECQAAACCPVTDDSEPDIVPTDELTGIETR